MRELIKNYQGFDRFLKDQLLIGLFIQCVWCLVGPLVHKLQGLLWTTTFISVYLIMMRSAGLFVPYFKGTHLKKVYRSIICLNFLYGLATILYFYDQHVFLWAEVILSIFYCINGQLLGIGWDVYVVGKYERKTFEDFKYCATFRDSVGGIGGYSIVILIYSFLDEYQSMKLFVFMMVFVLLLQVYNYFRHYKGMIE